MTKDIKTDDILARLYATICARRGGDASRSYVAQLLAEGEDAVRAKLAEELGELLEASKAGDAELRHESADLIFHLLVLLAARGLAWEDVLQELRRREGRSGLDEKAARAKA